MKDFLATAIAIVVAFVTMFSVLCVLLCLTFGSVEILWWILTGDFFHVLDPSPREAW